MDENMYREQPQMTRNDWSQMIQQQQSQLAQSKQSNSVWPEKLTKQVPSEDKPSHKKVQSKDSEYSEEYLEGDDNNQADGDDSTTTVAPKKVKFLSKRFNTIWLCFYF